VSFTVYGTKLPLQDLARDAILILAAFASLWLTPNEHREANGFSWEPILEVALLFAGIFVCAGRSWRCSTPVRTAPSPG